MHLLLNRYNKILFSNNGIFTDYSEEMRRWNSMTMPLDVISSEDFIYIGCPHSFTTRFFHINVANADSASLDIEYYYGQNNWRKVKNLADETRTGAITLSKSGFVSWDLPTDWIRNQINSIPELPYDSATGDGYGYFWIRIKVSQDIADGSLKWLGLLWTNQDYMLTRWPEVLSASYLPEGKTDWYELIEVSTQDVANDLNIQEIIDYDLQVKDINEVATLTALKTLINILTPLMSSITLAEMRKTFIELYNQQLRVRIKAVDQNEDEKITEKENVPIFNTRIKRT